MMLEVGGRQKCSGENYGMLPAKTPPQNMKIEPVALHSLGEKICGVLYLPEVEGPVPALLVCHGAGEFKENYLELCEFLRNRGVAALAIDMHGHGASEGDRFYVDMREWVADVRAAVEFLVNHPRINREKIGAFGLSSGGTAILEAALVEPRLKTLVTLDATVRNAIPWVCAVFLQLLVLIGRVKKKLTNHDLRLPLIKLFGGLHLVSDPEIHRQLSSNPRALEAFNAFPLPGAAQSFFVDTLKRVGEITVPTLVLWGEDDQLDTPETARLLFDALFCKKQLYIIPGNGHAGHLDRNREQVFALTAEWVLENLASVPLLPRAG